MATTRWQGAWRRGRRFAGGTLEWTWLLTLAVARLGFTFLIAIAGLFLFIQIAYHVFAGATQAFDESVIRWFSQHRDGPHYGPIRAVTYLANGETIAVVSALAFGWFAFRRRFNKALTVLVAVLVGWGLIEGLKAVFGRPRPSFNSIAEAGLSFPSGHAFFSLTLYGLLAYLLAREAPWRLKRGIWTGVIVLALLVGTSRMFLGVHYPSDVAAGFCAAAFWLWGCLKLPDLFARQAWGEWRKDRLSDLAFAREEVRTLGPDAPAVLAEAESALKNPGLAPLPRLALGSSVAFGKLYRHVERAWPKTRRYATRAIPAAAALTWTQGNQASTPAQRLAVAAQVLVTGTRPKEESALEDGAAYVA
ncbi:MAG: phosphatase PAP2 family protein [Fimbriimonas sp.]